jgi:hypothetical protein
LSDKYRWFGVVETMEERSIRESGGDRRIYESCRTLKRNEVSISSSAYEARREDRSKRIKRFTGYMNALGIRRDVQGFDVLRDLRKIYKQQVSSSDLFAAEREEGSSRRRCQAGVGG